MPLRLAGDGPASYALILHRRLQRHGISRLPEIAGHKEPRRKFKFCPVDYFHTDIIEVRTAEGKAYLYVAIDRTSKFAFVQLVNKAGRASACAFLVALIAAVPYKIHIVLTGNSIQFTFPSHYADGPTATYMNHMFNIRCRENEIEHRLNRVRHPWSNGQIERMSQTIKEAIATRYHYDSHTQLAAHFHDFISAYNYGRRPKTLRGFIPYGHISIIWQSEPERFMLNSHYQMSGLK